MTPQANDLRSVLAGLVAKWRGEVVEVPPAPHGAAAKNYNCALNACADELERELRTHADRLTALLAEHGGEAVAWVDPRELLAIREYGGMIVATSMAESESRRTQALFTTPPPQPRGEGVLVPREPTPEIVEAICRAHAGKAEWPGGFDIFSQAIRRRHATDGYAAMLAAAPGEGSGPKYSYGPTKDSPVLADFTDDPGYGTTPPPASQSADRNAYEGAREDLLDWKGRAQRAEATLRSLGYKGTILYTTPPPQARGKTLYDRRDQVYALAEREGPRLYAALKNLLEAVNERRDQCGIESATIAAAQFALDNATLAAAPGEGSGEADRIETAAFLEQFDDFMDCATPPPASQSAETEREVVGDPRVGVTIQTDASILRQNASQSAPSAGSGPEPGEPAPPPDTPAQHYLASVNGVATQEWQDGFNEARIRREHLQRGEQPPRFDTSSAGSGELPEPWQTIDLLPDSDDLFWFLRWDAVGGYSEDGPRRPQDHGGDSDDGWQWFAPCESPSIRRLATAGQGVEAINWPWVAHALDWYAGNAPDSLHAASAAKQARLIRQLATAGQGVEDLREIARLIGTIFYYGSFKAETHAERALESLLRANGFFYETEQAVFDAAPTPEQRG